MLRCVPFCQVLERLLNEQLFTIGLPMNFCNSFALPGISSGNAHAPQGAVSCRAVLLNLADQRQFGIRSHPCRLLPPTRRIQNQIAT